MAFQYLKNKLAIFFREILWDDEQLPESKNLRTFILKPLRVAVMVSKGFYRHECFGRATTLTYVTLLNLIPLIAIALAILSFLAAENSNVIEKYLQDFFAPAGSATSNGALETAKTNQFVKNVMGFVRNVNINQISFYGYLFLFLSSLSLISSVENSFNHIWGVKRGRSLLRKTSSYSIILFILPFFIVISLSLSANYQSFAVGKAEVLDKTLLGFKGKFYVLDLMISVSSYAVRNLGIAFSHLLQFLFAWLFFSLLYFYLPYTKVKAYFSLKGGLITAIMFELAKPLFTGYIKYFMASTSIGKIYGAISFLPFSLFWIYIVWIIILLGAELTYAFQNVKAYQSEFLLGNLNRKSKDLIVLKMVKEILVHQQVNIYFTVEDLANRFNAPYYFVEGSISLLVSSGIIVEDVKTEQLRIVDERITPGKVMHAMYLAGKNYSTEIKNVSPELEKQLEDWENILLSNSGKFDV